MDENSIYAHREICDALKSLNTAALKLGESNHLHAMRILKKIRQAEDALVAAIPMLLSVQNK